MSKTLENKPKLTADGGIYLASFESTQNMPMVDPVTSRLLTKSRPETPSLLKVKAEQNRNFVIPNVTSIEELARGLRYDPQLIFQWVYNNIEFTPTFGLQKGALGALLDGHGNAFDQSDLLVALLREAAIKTENVEIIEANFILGTIQLTASQCQTWVGTNEDLTTAKDLFANGGFPVAMVGTSPNQILEIAHCWVQLKLVDDRVFVLDPSFKAYTSSIGIGDSALEQWTGFEGLNQFMDAALEGATTDGNDTWIKDVNKANIYEKLNAMSTNLVANIRKHDSDWIARLSGSVSPGDVVSITVHHANLDEGRETVSYTVQAGDAALENIAAGLATALLASAPIVGVGVLVDLDGETITLSNTTSTSYIGDVSTDASVHLTIIPNQPASLETIIGGRTIVPLSVPFNYTASLSYQKPGDEPDIWNDSVPNAYRSSLEIDGSSMGNEFLTPITLYADEIYGKRLSLQFDNVNPLGTNNTPRLILDGETIAVGDQVFGASTGTMPLFVRVRHAFTVGTAPRFAFNIAPNQSASQSHWRYLLGVSFGTSGRGMVEHHQQRLREKEYFAGESGEFDESVIGEKLAVLWSTYMANLANVRDLAGRLTGNIYQNHHCVGLAFYENLNENTSNEFKGCAFDVKGELGALSSLNSVTAYGKNHWRVYGLVQGLHEYGLEMLSLQQYTGFGSASATRVLEAANSEGVKIFKGTPANWTTVQGQLAGYNSGDKGAMFSGIHGASTGTVVFVPETAIHQLDARNCKGWIFWDSGRGTAGGSIIQLKGGAQTEAGDPPKSTSKDKPCDCAILDPVNARTGDFKYEHSDIRVGSGDFPYSLSFESAYDSRLRFEKSSMGLGWRHNWMASAEETSDAFEGFGANSAIHAACTIVQLFVLRDLIASDANLPVDKFQVASLCNSWWIGQQWRSGVRVRLPVKDYLFTRLADGSYSAPPQTDYRLIKVDSLYRLITEDKTEYRFNAEGWLQKIVFPFGIEVHLVYENGYLISANNGLSRELGFTYSAGRLTSVSDGTGRSVSFEYDSGNQLVSTTDPMEESTVFEYDAPGRIAKVYRPQNPQSPVTQNFFDSFSRVVRQLDAVGNESIVYYAGSSTTTVDSDGSMNQFLFDKHGNNICDIDSDGNATHYFYDARRRLSQVKFPEGNSERYVRDEANNVLLVEYLSKPSLSPSTSLSVVKTYDELCNKIKTEQDALGNVTSYTYDHRAGFLGNMLAIAQPLVGLLRPTTTFTYNSRGQVETEVDALGIEVSYQYDNANETLKSLSRDSTLGGFDLTRAYEYDNRGDIIVRVDQKGNRFVYEFDAKRRLILAQAPSPFGWKTHISYDKNDNATAIKRETGLSSSPWQEYIASYNNAGQLQSVTDPNGNVVSRVYSAGGKLWKFIDADGRITEFLYDNRGNIRTISGPAAEVNRSFDHNRNGRVSKITDARGGTMLFSYDDFDRQSRITFDDGTFEQTIFDANGNVSSWTKRNGLTINYEYDALNRLTRKGSEGMPVVSYEYDLVGRLLKILTPNSVPGNPAVGQWTFVYDSAGRLVSEEAPGGKIAYEHDDNDNVVKLVYPDLYFVERTYDALNRLTNIKLNGDATPVLQISYDGLSRKTLIEFENASRQIFSYDLANRLDTIEHTIGAYSATMNHEFDRSGNLRTSSVTNQGQHWKPTSEFVETYGTADEMNQYPHVGGRIYDYDLNGCLISDGKWTFSYDAENQLVSSESAVEGKSVEFFYDPVHRQVKKVFQGSSTETSVSYLYSGWQRIADYDPGNVVNSRYIFGEGLDEPLVKVAGSGEKTYLFADRLGSIVRTLNGNGDISSYTFSPWGETNDILGTGIGFTGQKFEPELNLYSFRYRHYSPEIGRFLQPDPIGPVNNSNLYSYVFEAPTNFTDPFGLDPRPVDGSFLGPQDQSLNSTTITPDVFVYVSHGAPRHGGVTQSARGGKLKSAYDLATEIKKKNTKNKPVLLAACEGNMPMGLVKNKSLGQVLAENLGVPVIAVEGTGRPQLGFDVYSGQSTVTGIEGQFFFLYDGKGKIADPGVFPNLQKAIEAALALCKKGKK